MVGNEGVLKKKKKKRAELMHFKSPLSPLASYHSVEPKTFFFFFYLFEMIARTCGRVSWTAAPRGIVHFFRFLSLFWN